MIIQSIRSIHHRCVLETTRTQYSILLIIILILYMCVRVFVCTVLFIIYEVCVRVCVLHINRSGLNPHPAILRSCQSDTVRGLLDRKRSKEHLQSSNESMTTRLKQNKNDKKKGRITQSTCQKKIEEGHSKE